MGRFRFSLENILSMKEKLEEQAKNEYAQANALLFTEEQKLSDLTVRLDGAKDRLKNVLVEKLSVTEIRKREDAVEIIKTYVLQQKLIVKQCEKQVEVARQKLQEAMQERKIYEKLKEKAFEEFVREEGRQEQKITDELMSYKYGTKAKNA